VSLPVHIRFPLSAATTTTASPCLLPVSSLSLPHPFPVSTVFSLHPSHSKPINFDFSSSAPLASSVSHQPFMLGFGPASHPVCFFSSYPCVSDLTRPFSPSTTSITRLPSPALQASHRLLARVLRLTCPALTQSRIVGRATGGV